MAYVSVRQLLDHAAENGYALPAFNVNDMEQVQAVLEAAEQTASPVILQASSGATKYAGNAFFQGLMQAAVETWPRIPIAIHQDHAHGPATCMRAIRAGFTSVMIDGSLMPDGKTPSSYDYNVETTRTVVEMAHPVGVTVEGELGVLGSLESGRAGKEDETGAEGTLTREQLLTDPEQAQDFVQRTGADSLAIAIGTSHGAYKFTSKPTGETLAIDRVREIHERIPDTALVLHGSSSVPQEWLEVIREYGGEIPETYGVPVPEIQQAIRYGVRKVNIDTDLRLAMTGAIRRVFGTKPGEIDPRKYLAEAKAAARSVCVQRYEEFGSAGMAPKIEPMPLERVAERYASRELVGAR